ncbi:unnamed protein product [Polarella glacialis]|uniref:Uncharacterized protein n=1 Tax=Polarella glacialis TaxID=89957 RepID=A0A813GZQ3_POLGL|nr:unnamed protein product [Polarella glacialis]CAE8630860.1 unnamed protein product [Polarella glacialis]
MMSSRSMLLPVALVATAVACVLCGPSFVFGGRAASSSQTSLRTGTAQRALPVEALDFLADSSMMNAESLEVSTPGWWANIVCLVVPITYLITLYLQSERTKAEMRNRK